MRRPIDIPSFINGHFRQNSQDIIEVENFRGEIAARIHKSGNASIQQAIKTAHLAQKELQKIPLRKILKVISLTTEYWMETDEKRQIVVELTGSSLHFVTQSMEEIKAWARSLDRYLAQNGIAEPKGRAPVVAIMPANSSQEVLYTMAHALATKNAMILRPSTRAACAFASADLAYAFRKAVREIGDPKLDVLLGAFSVVNTDINYADLLARDGWTYVMFGDRQRVKEIADRIRSKAHNTNCIRFGDSLAVSIVLDDLDGVADKLLKSGTVNAGNECISTRIIYAKKSVYNILLKELKVLSKEYISKDPMEKGSIGIVLPQNAEFIISNEKRWRNNVSIGEYLGKPTINCSIVGISDSTRLPIQMPGPVIYVRSFEDEHHLLGQIRVDQRANGTDINIVTAIYSKDRKVFSHLQDLLVGHGYTYRAQQNIPTHHFDPCQPHQGINLLRELIE